MRALLLCAAAAYAAITNERLVDPVAKEMALADEKRYRENYSPRTPKELAEDERALQFYTKIMSQVTNWATDDHKPRPPSPAPPSAVPAADAARVLAFGKAVRAAHSEGIERFKGFPDGGPRADALLGERFEGRRARAVPGRALGCRGGGRLGTAQYSARHVQYFLENEPRHRIINYGARRRH